MAKKKKTTKTKKAAVIRRTPITKEMHLKHLIAVSRKNDSGIGTDLDLFFSQQAERLEKELAEYRRANGKR